LAHTWHGFLQEAFFDSRPLEGLEFEFKSVCFDSIDERIHCSVEVRKCTFGK